MTARFNLKYGRGRTRTLKRAASSSPFDWSSYGTVWGNYDASIAASLSHAGGLVSGTSQITAIANQTGAGPAMTLNSGGPVYYSAHATIGVPSINFVPGTGVIGDLELAPDSFVLFLVMSYYAGTEAGSFTLLNGGLDDGFNINQNGVFENQQFQWSTSSDPLDPFEVQSGAKVCLGIAYGVVTAIYLNGNLAVSGGDSGGEFPDLQLGDITGDGSGPTWWLNQLLIYDGSMSVATIKAIQAAQATKT
jgi:hypothetical protein